LTKPDNNTAGMKTVRPVTHSRDNLR
jgi:hypothetical protein